jgi:hypothetical protein
VHKGESTQLVSLVTKFVFGEVQGCTGFWNRVSLFMVYYMDNIGRLGRTKIHRIFLEDREVLCNEVYNIMAHFRSEEKEGKFYHFFHVV